MALSSEPTTSAALRCFAPFKGETRCLLPSTTDHKGVNLLTPALPHAVADRAWSPPKRMMRDRALVPRVGRVTGTLLKYYCNESHEHFVLIPTRVWKLLLVVGAARVDRRGRRHRAHRRQHPRADGDHRRQLHGPRHGGGVRALAGARGLPHHRGGPARLPRRRHAGRGRDRAAGDLPAARRGGHVHRASGSSRRSARAPCCSPSRTRCTTASRATGWCSARSSAPASPRSRARATRCRRCSTTSTTRPVVNILETEAFRAVLAPFGHITWTALLGGALFASSRGGRFHLTRAARPALRRRRHAARDLGPGLRLGGHAQQGRERPGLGARVAERGALARGAERQELIWFNVFYNGILVVLGLIGVIWIVHM